jgi:hypothetical protein
VRAAAADFACAAGDPGWRALPPQVIAVGM